MNLCHMASSSASNSASASSPTSPAMDRTSAGFGARWSYAHSPLNPSRDAANPNLKPARNAASMSLLLMRWFYRPDEAPARFSNVVGDVAPRQRDCVGVVDFNDLPFWRVQVGRILAVASPEIPVIAVLHNAARIA